MEARDLFRYTASSAASHRLRSGLTALGIAIGVTAVVLLTSIGTGLREYMLAEFTQFGTNIVAINPGVTSTFGAPTGVINSQRPLTLEDAQALKRVPYVVDTMAAVQGNASVEANGRERRVTVNGVGPEMPQVFQFKVAMGEFLPPDDPRAPRALAVLGSKLRDELYGDKNPLGDRIRVGGDRYRVIGVMEAKGTVLGLDLDELDALDQNLRFFGYNRFAALSLRRRDYLDDNELSLKQAVLEKVAELGGETCLLYTSDAADDDRIVEVAGGGG